MTGSDPERENLTGYNKAILNILEDSAEERAWLRDTQRAIMNLLEDLDAEKRWVEAANRQLAQSNAELEQFAYVASHDLQEPLRMVASYTQLLEERYKDIFDDKAKKIMFYAVDGARRMQSLITDLLEFSRVGSRGQPLVRTDSRTALAEALRNLATAIEESGATITSGDLPPVLSDPTQLVQIFQNLVGNSIKFRGPTPPQIHVSAVSREGDWTFCVRDNGIGIEEKYFRRIFVIFQRLHTREEYPGTGIGLALCRRIIERHGGRIWLESEPGLGSSFFFTLKPG